MLVQRCLLTCLDRWHETIAQDHNYCISASRPSDGSGALLSETSDESMDPSPKPAPTNENLSDILEAAKEKLASEKNQ